MSDCELIFKAPKLKIEKCLEKSLLRDLDNFKSEDPEKIKKFVKLIIITNVLQERNLNNLEELRYFYDILFHFKHLEAIGLMEDENCEVKFYFEVAIR